jgi:hypothetical protein
MKKFIMQAIKDCQNSDEIMHKISNPLMPTEMAAEYIKKETGISYSQNTLNHFFVRNGIRRKRHNSIIDRELYKIKKLKAFSKCAADEKYGIGDLLDAFEQLTGIRTAPGTMRKFRYRCGLEQRGTGQYRSLKYEVKKGRISDLAYRSIKNKAVPIKSVIEMLKKETGRSFSESTICEHRRGMYEK